MAALRGCCYALKAKRGSRCGRLLWASQERAATCYQDVIFSDRFSTAGRDPSSSRTPILLAKPWSLAKGGSLMPAQMVLPFLMIFLSSPFHNHASRPQSFFLSDLASLASLFFLPHLSLIASIFASACFARSGAVTHKLTKNCEQLNFSAKRTRLQYNGSSVLNLRISSISTCVRWYCFSYIGRTGFNVFALTCVACRCAAIRAKIDVFSVGARAPAFDADNASSYSFLRGSDWGRNLLGVWYTLGALGGGLKMMWSFVSVVAGANEGSCFTRRSFLVLRYEAALRRHVLHTKLAVSAEKREGLADGDRKDMAMEMVV